MLLAREKKIVTLLIEHEDKLTTTQIATSLKVSSRTIKADIKKINEELEKHSCRINSQQGVGLWIEYDNHEAKKYLKEVTRDTADLYLSPEVRKYHLAVELLLQDDYTSMEALAKEYYISKATVLNDLNELDELWEHYGVHFIKKVKYGIKVEGNERNLKQNLICHLYFMEVVVLAKRIKEGKFKDEILPVELKDRKGNITIFDTDEGPREGQSMEKLAKLRPCFVKGGTVTAANSSSLNDGAAAVVVMSKEKAEELGVTPKMKIEGYAIAGFDAELMGYSPKFSSEKLANKLGVDLKSIDMFEINEAFASQAYAVSRDLGLDPEKVNIYGGGISIGHPIGATGAMLTVKVMYELMRTDKKDAMISMCIGGGQGISMYFTKCE